MKYPAVCLSAIALALAGTTPLLRGQDTGLVVHEWGTFTSLQDETGRAIGGINTDDEPVPDFVHDVAKTLLIRPTEAPPMFFQGAPSCHPDVTMRLETPVLYLHAPESFHGPIDVRVAFNGGWLTQFYPQAAATTPGIGKDGGGYGHLTGETVGRLDWLGLRSDAAGDGPKTPARVWLAPRAVQASELQTQDGETERFLFYRGVGHLDAPLRVVRSPDGETLRILPGGGPLPTGSEWLVDIRADGTAAYRTLGPIAATPAATPANFAPGDYSAGTVDRLRADLRSALVSGGLFADEADALLNTWEVSYFKSAGLRLFFLVPQPWTDRVLPLTISGAPPATRVMVGRIELVTAQQRALLARIAAAPADDLQPFLQRFYNRQSEPGLLPAWDDVLLGKSSFAAAGITLPAAYRAYLDLGRFRNALLLDAQHRDGNANLAAFTKAFHLEGYEIPWYAALTR